jgi:double-stranded uracil-DNA glycosylase
MPDRARSFPPIATPDARILILGSMPGRASLAANQYYAHPRNAFWSLMGRLFAFDSAQDYPARVKALNDFGIAVWDVLASCQRPGSLDSAIAKNSVVTNDLIGFLAAHRLIGHIFFNGGTAEKLFHRHIMPTPATNNLRLIRLPSTSPAHAALGFAQKLAAWRAISVAVDAELTANSSTALNQRNSQ